jgi:hypothetical protein
MYEQLQLIGMHAAALSQDPDAAADDSGVSEIAAAVGGADMLVEAAWTQPSQRKALLQWDAALRLLGSSSDATAGEGFDEVCMCSIACNTAQLCSMLTLMYTVHTSCTRYCVSGEVSVCVTHAA